MTDQPASSLAGRRILVVEDEAIIAMDIEFMLRSQGCVLLGPVPTVDAALALLEDEQPDAALLDLNLRGELSVPVAEALRARNVGFVIVSGYSAAQLGEPALEGEPWVRKPIHHGTLIRTLAGVLDDSEPE